MKRAIIIFILAAMVLTTTGLWFYSANTGFSQVDFLSFGVIFLLVAFAVFIGYKRFGSARRGEPTEDELSKKVLQKTAALSYYISLYLWVTMIYIKDRVSLDIEEILGIGILAMAVTFAVCWMVFNFRGVRNE